MNNWMKTWRPLAVLLSAVLVISGCLGGGKQADAEKQSISAEDGTSETGTQEESTSGETGVKEDSATEDTDAEDTAAEDTAAEDSAEASDSAQEEEPVPAVYEVFRSFTAEDLDGNPVTEEIFADSKITMVNIWGTFCGPCLQEMPYLAEISHSYEESEFRIAGLLCDVIGQDGTADPSQTEYARELAKETGADYLQIVPTGELMDLLFYIQYVPTSVFVDSEGNVIGEEYVGSRSKAEWENVIRSVLESAE